MKFSDVTPNLIVANVERSMAFYRDVLGFSVSATVPEGAGPYVFAWMQRDGVAVFLNSHDSVEEHADLASRPIGGTATLFIVLEADDLQSGVDAMLASVAGRAKVMMPMKDQFYGMREFGIEDPDGYVIFFAQRIPGSA